MGKQPSSLSHWLLGLAGPVLWGLPVVATEVAAFLGNDPA